MPLYLDSYVRFEPIAPVGDLDEGFAARIADPAWFLGRQWQLGEHRGEDAGSPVRVDFRMTLRPLTDSQGRPATRIPTEAVVEKQPLQWWTPSRKIRLGHQISQRAADHREVAERLRAPDLLAKDLPPPYDFMNGTVVDGLEAYRRRAELGLSDEWFGELPEDATDGDRTTTWNASRFEMDEVLHAGSIRLDVPRHEGGTIDWYSCDTSETAGEDAATTECGSAQAVRLNYPGAPQPRWWQIEDRHFDIGGFAPDRSHFATLLLIDVVSSHSDDWFLVPIESATPAVGHVLSVVEACVTDSFDDRFDLRPPADGWSMIATDLASPAAGWRLPLFPQAVMPLIGEPLDEVDLGIDEDANLLWAAERRVHGRMTEDAAITRGDFELEWPLDGSKPSPYRYDPSSLLQPSWHPYVLVEDGAEATEGRRRRLVQARVADLRSETPSLMPQATSPLLQGPDPTRPHEIDASAVPELGARVEARYVLARGTDGVPHLWLRRRRLPKPYAPPYTLSFDTVTLDAPKRAETPRQQVRGTFAEIRSTPSANGIERITGVVELTNEGDRVVEDIVVYVESGIRDRELPLHRPALVDSVSPGERFAVAFDAVLVHGRQATSSAFRAVAAFAQDRFATPVVTQARLELAPVVSSDELRVEIDGAARGVGPVISIDVIVHAGDVPLDDIQVQVRPRDRESWGEVAILERLDDSAAGAPRWRASWNAKQHPRVSGIRVIGARGLDGLVISGPVPVDIATPVAASPTLAVKLSLQDARSAGDEIEVLAVVELTSAGDEAFEDLSLTFEVRPPDVFEWSPVAASLRSAALVVPAGGSLAVPAMLRMPRTRDGLVIVRVAATSARWSLTVTAHHHRVFLPLFG